MSQQGKTSPGAPNPRTVTLAVVALLMFVTAALIFIPNRYWVAASKKLVPPEKFRTSTRPDPWG